MTDLTPKRFRTLTPDCKTEFANYKNTINTLEITLFSRIIANILIIEILALLAWVIYDLYRGNKRYAAKLAAHQTESEAK
ncbi:hypothetical protein [Lactiplantibacillus plantarum]|uniref:hypothetical protein n=1 Tax=Lactiplantibacillus plantarum TaxID=1590 RepID=UPI000977230E|nr:hypothetical protein [Lactiplantibacillus plantarum]